MTNLEISLSADDAERLTTIAAYCGVSPNNLMRTTIGDYCAELENIRYNRTLTGEEADEDDFADDKDTDHIDPEVDTYTKAASYIIDIPAWQTVTLMESVEPPDITEGATVEEKAQRVVRDILKLFVERVPEFAQADTQ